MDETTRRRLLFVLVVVTSALLVADLAGSQVAASVRQAGGVVFGPVQRVLSGAPRDALADAQATNVRLAVRVNELEGELNAAQQARDLIDAPSAAGRRVVVGRVVATERSPLGGRSVTLDIGARDGVVLDATVVSADGLVGRVIGVAPWTSDVEVLGAERAVVGVRVGARGTLGTVGPSTSADTVVRPLGALTLTLIQPGAPSPGDAITTLGSIDEKPYAAGILVGTVSSVDADRGSLTRTASVTPAIKADALDVVAVLLPAPRVTPRPGTSGPTATPRPPTAAGTASSSTGATR